MKKKSTLLFFALFLYLFSYAQQITTDNAQQPNTLIQNLVGSDCITVDNIASPINGQSNAIVSYGTFYKDNSNFPLQSGLILSTGRVNSAGNTVISEDLNEGQIDWGTDPDLLDVVGIDQTLNATTIEFDFSSPNNFIAFNYLFASDEYQQEYPCNFKDVFAILIKEVGSSDSYVNIAVVPETTTEVSTNSIHPNITGFCEAENETYFEGYNVGDTNFNGRTAVLTARADIIANTNYHIKFIIADHIDQRFDSAVFIEAEGFGNSIDLGPDQSICGSDLTLEADINNPAATYTWFLNENPIVGETNSSLDVNVSGTYDLEISLPTSSGTCTLSDSVEIEIIPFQDAAPIDTWLVCNPFESDGTFTFDFTEKNDEIYANLPSTNYNISYHLNLEDAENNSNAIVGPYVNTERLETIYVRIESLSGDCLQIGLFDLIVSDSPDSLEYTIDVCNGELVEQVFASLNYLSNVVSNFDLNTTVYFYLTEADALNSENELSEFPNLESEPDLFYAKIESEAYICPSIVPIHLDYIPQTDLGIDRYIFDLCIDPNYSEEENGQTYDYDSLVIDHNLDFVLETFENDYPGAYAIIEQLIGSGNPRMHATSSNQFSIAVAIRYIDENCPARIPMEIHKNLLFNIFGRGVIIQECDDPSNDGLIDVLLSELIEELKSGYNQIDLVLYETESDRDNQINPLNPNTVLTLAHEAVLYAQSSNNGCTYNFTVTHFINSVINIPPTTLDFCGNLDPVTNLTSIATPALKTTYLNNANIVGSVNFYLSYEDALNETNEITDTFEVNGNQQTFYLRVVNQFAENNCPSITTLELNITSATEASDPQPLIICDDDQDGFSTINLEAVIPELANGATDLDFSFYETYDDAVANTNPISNPNQYNTASIAIFIRAQVQGTDCFSIFNYNIQVYANPQLLPIADYIYCTPDVNADPEILLETQDFSIINGQTDMQVLYFETENDAIDRINAIDKDVAYLPVTNPQTIFVRLENALGNSCYKIAPMQIEVRQAPIYTVPTDVFECDVNSTGFVTTDLSEKILEIHQGSPTELNTTFHLTPLNAEMGSNALPLNYTSIANPQLIYARILNINSGCYAIETFSINTLALPDVQYGKSLTACANNNDFALEWNLTQIELEVLEGRQYNIGFTYFESENDLLSNSNPISNPEAYTNITAPQTVYVRINNATTGCFDYVPFELIINSPPEINPISTYALCANPENSVDLNEITSLLVDNTYNLALQYFSNENDAQSNTNPLSLNHIYTNTAEILYVRLEYTTTHCYAIHPIQLEIYPLPIAYTPNALETCDDDTDGYALFQLDQQNSDILGNQNPDDYTLNYYTTAEDAIAHTNAINTSYNAYNGQIIYVRLEHNSTGCFATTQFAVTVNPIPFAAITDQVLCINDGPLVVSADTNIATDTYLWSTGASASEIEITEVGTYTVTITNALGCQNSSTFNVTVSETAEIDVVETVDFSDPNNITLSVHGIGNYLYQLNDGPFQSASVFYNVPIGLNTLTVRDLNGCGNLSYEVVVIDTPKHMTPNNDGDFDTWHITGVETLPGTVISIYDRTGKLLTQLRHDSPGWDGRYNNSNMPAGDYWFVANVIQNGEQFQVKGHFALRR